MPKDVNLDQKSKVTTSATEEVELASKLDISKYRKFINFIVELFGVTHDKAEIITKWVLSISGSILSLITAILGILHGTGVI